MRVSRHITQSLGGLAVMAGFLAAQVSPSLAIVQSVVITIDSGTTQPVATGLIPATANEHLVVLAEGAIRPFVSPSWYENGWFGPAGQTRLARGGQPIGDGMPYGALVGNFNIGITSFQFLGRVAGDQIPGGAVGDEYNIALNMSDADLAGMEGSITATLILIPDQEALVATVTVDDAPVWPISTGLTAGAGDRFIVLPRGAMRFFSDPLIGGWYGPEGMSGFNRSGQPESEGPFGGLYGLFGGSIFYIGDGGTWSTQTADLGDELLLLPNMSTADQGNVEGSFEVHIIQIPATPVAVPGSAPHDELVSITAGPNPMRTEAQIRYELAEADQVRLRVYDTHGRWVRTLIDAPMSYGAHEITWDGRDDSGNRVASGAYFYQLSTSGGSRTGRLVVAN